jgi:hypothetical protein
MHTAREQEISMPGIDYLSRNVHTAQSRCAGPARGVSRSLNGRATFQGSFTRDCPPQTTMNATVHVTLIDVLGGQVISFQNLRDVDGTQISSSAMCSVRHPHHTHKKVAQRKTPEHSPLIVE